MFFTGLASSLLPYRYFITIFGLGKRLKKITRPLYVCSRSIHLNICYYHQDLHRGPFHPGSRQRLRHDPRALLLVEAGRSPRRRSIGATLERHPFSGLVASAGELLHTP